MRATVGIAIIITASSVMAQGQSLQEQAICAEQAQKAFQAYNNAGSVPGFKSISSDYQSHYNTKLDKCLILIDAMNETTNGKILTSALLMDAIERRVFANFHWETKDAIGLIAPYISRRMHQIPRETNNSFFLEALAR